MPGTVLRDFQSSYQQLLRIYSLSEEQDREIVDNLKVCFRDLGAWKALLEAGPTGVLSMVRALGLPDVALRRNAIAVLEHVITSRSLAGIKREHLMPLLSRSLYDNDPGVRSVAARVLYVHFRIAPDVDLLRGWLDGTYGNAQASAVEALLIGGHLDSIPREYLDRWSEVALNYSPLFSLWHDGLPPHVVSVAGEAMQLLEKEHPYSADHARAVGDLVRELVSHTDVADGHRDRQERLPAHRVEAIAPFAGIYLDQWLQCPTFLPSPPENADQASGSAFRLAALRVLGCVADHVGWSEVSAWAIPLLLRSCYDSSTPCVQEALRVLAPLKDPRARTEYERLLHHRAEEVRLQAAAALRQLPQSAN